MWHVERELGTNILFVAREIKSEFIPESYSSWPVGTDWEFKIMRRSSGTCSWRLAFPRVVQNVSSGDIRKSRKAPSELCVSSCCPPFPISLISPLLKLFTSLAAIWERITFILITGLQSEVGTQTEAQWAGRQPWDCYGTGWYGTFPSGPFPKSWQSGIIS